MKTSIYVMTHKKYQLPSDKIYQPLHVGRELGEDLGYPGDNIGDNISDLNPLFGELTGVYWVWKNDTSSDVVGICHYRRFFGNENHQLLNSDEIEHILSSHEIITSDRVITKETSYKLFARAHNIKDYDTIGTCLQQLYPEYYSSFLSNKQEHGTYFGNLMIMRKPLFDQYCEWLFNILFSATEYIDVTGYDLYHARVYGFLSEILENVWIRHNDLNVYESPVIFTSEKAETTELKKAIASLVKNNQIAEARALYYDITRIRPDVLLSASDISGELLIIEQILFIMEEEDKQRIKGLNQISSKLSDIIAYYKEYGKIWLRIRAGKAENEEIERFQNSYISEIANPVIERLFFA